MRNLLKGDRKLTGETIVGSMRRGEPVSRQEILEEFDPLARAHKVTQLVTRELEVLEIGSKIQSQIRESMDKTQRDFYLRQQLSAIRP